MSTRSAMNKRTQDQLRGEGKVGMARRSAASAKPARTAAGSVRVVAASGKAKRKQMEQGESLAGLSKEEKRARKAAIRRQEDRVYAASNTLMKEREDYARLRKLWWIFMGAGMALVAISFVLMAMTNVETASDEMVTAQVVCIALAYVAIIGGFIFDFMKIRPIRNEERARAESMSERQLAAVLERSAEAEKRK